MPDLSKPPADEKAFLLAIQDQFDTLSRQLKLIARYVEAKRSQIGIQSIQEVADACAVQPSAVVRFAKHFGFDGFTAMQRVFRDGLAQKNRTHSKLSIPVYGKPSNRVPVICAMWISPIP